MAGRKEAGLRADDERGRHWRAFRFAPTQARPEAGHGGAQRPPTIGELGQRAPPEVRTVA